MKKLIWLVPFLFLVGCSSVSSGVRQGLRSGDEVNDWIFETVTP